MGYLLLLATLSWSFVGISVKTAGMMVDGTTITFFRFFIGILSLGLFLFIRYRSIGLRLDLGLDRRNRKSALRLVPFSIAVIVSNTSILFTILWAYLFFHDPITGYIIGGASPFAVGLGLLNWPSRQNDSRQAKPSPSRAAEKGLTAVPQFSAPVKDAGQKRIGKAMED